MKIRRPKLFSYRGPPLSGVGYEVYRHLARSPRCKDDRAYLESLWSRYAAMGPANPEFLKRFPKECPARIWEMRLACMFDDWKFSFVPSPKAGAGMDFGLRLDCGGTCWVEATVPEPGDGPDRLEVPDGQVLHGETISQAHALRYLNAIALKREQYRRALESGLVHRDDAFIIAIDEPNSGSPTWKRRVSLRSSRRSCLDGVTRPSPSNSARDGSAVCLGLASAFANTAAARLAQPCSCHRPQKKSARFSSIHTT